MVDTKIFEEITNEIDEILLVSVRFSHDQIVGPF